jgi:hypothetical protein
MKNHKFEFWRRYVLVPGRPEIGVLLGLRDRERLKDTETNESDSDENQGHWFQGGNTREWKEGK